MKSEKPDLTEEERAEIYAKNYRESLSLAKPGENSLMYLRSWGVMRNIDLAAELIKDGAGAATAPTPLGSVYFFAIEQAGKGKHKTDFMIIWGEMGAMKDEK